MKMAVLTPCFFPNHRPLRMFEESCKAHGIIPHFYGEGLGYVPWSQLKIVTQLPALDDLQKHGYRDMGAPHMLASAETELQSPNAEGEHAYHAGVGRYRFHCVGGYIADLPWLIEKFTSMLPLCAEYGDDAEIWQKGYREGWFRPAIDYECRIFQTTHKAEDDLCIVSDGLANNATDSQPSVLHFNGGYSDPVSGKYERMIEWWNALYPDIPLTKEDCSL